MNHTGRTLLTGLAAAALLAACTDPFAPPTDGAAAESRDVHGWSHWGGPGGAHFTDATLIDRDNVGDLEIAWVFRSGDVSTVFQSTPIVAAGQLILCTPHNQVVALDPLTGGERWRHDPAVERHDSYANEGNCRSVSHWRDDAVPDAACGERIVMTTNDARMIVLDARTGDRCTDFGNDGELDLAVGVGRIRWDGEYQMTSPPAIVGDLAVVGSSVSDGGRVDAPSGVVRAYDVRTGELAWAFDLAPPGFDATRSPVSDRGWALGTPNVWAPIAADPGRDMVFLPTGNPAPDYYRQGPEDMDHYGSSVLALRGSTGEVLWQFRTVVDDFWDLDVPTMPILVDLERDGRTVPAVIQSTKMGFIFVLDRLTGEPLIDVEYQAVPRHGPLQEALSPTQPFPPPAFRVARDYEEGGSMFGLCDGLEAESVIGPTFTPLGERWTIAMPGPMGATNWGGIAVDAARGLLVVPVSSVPFRQKLISREAADEFLDVILDAEQSEEAKEAARRGFSDRFDVPPGVEVALQDGTDYLMARHAFLDPVVGLPCGGPPYGELLVIDLNAERQLWRRSHGTSRDVTALPLPIGMPGMGGPLLTASGLVFLGGASERTLRVYDVDDGAVLFSHRLPEPAHTVPMSYVVETEKGPRQFVVLAAGGDARTGIAGTSDHLVAFALPAAGGGAR
jgi:quinoprotein glucose dehydrogenase